MQKFTLFLLLSVGLFLIHTQDSFSQNLLQSRQSSYYTYVYQLTGKEAAAIYTSYNWDYDKSFFHTLLDSFPTDSVYKRKLPAGHYIKTFARQNKQQLEILSVTDFDAYVFNNSTDLNIQIIDHTGKTLSDAKVTLNGKLLKYVSDIQCYTQKKSNRKGFLEVEYEGKTAFFQLDKNLKNSWGKRTFVKTVWRTPLKYAWIPVRFSYNLPIDGVKSIVRKYPQGTIGWTKKVFVRLYEKTACLFDDSHCYEYNFSRKYQSYAVLNKPMFRPGDTVKAKAYIAKNNGKPLRKKVKVSMYKNYKNVPLTNLTPIHPGSYVYEFVLHDSLDLTLDNSYFLNFENKRGNEYIDKSFVYKDYELKNNTLTVSLSSKEVYQGDSLSVSIKGTDANDLNLKDASVSILVHSGNVYKYFLKQMFVPDTLFYAERKLEMHGQTTVTVPAVVFPKINMFANVQVVMTTSDKEMLSQTEYFTYNYESRQLDVSLENDSVRVVLKENGLRKETMGVVRGIDAFENETTVYEGVLPVQLPLNPYFAEYEAETEQHYGYVSLEDESDLLHFYTQRDENQLEITASNPRNIPFYYDLFKQNKRIEHGYGTDLQINLTETSQTDYYLFINYLWGGEVKSLNYRIPLETQALTMEITKQDVVYPGQKTEVEILLTDYRGNPVKGADVTAFGLTKKFNYQLEIPLSFQAKSYPKDLINTFKVQSLQEKDMENQPLDYPYWNRLSGLDSIPYYRFSYPSKDIYRFEYETVDSITQFAPFVFKNGEKQPVHVVYVDNKPVYFDWNTGFNPYSFAVSPGYHHITLRTSVAEITLDSVCFDAGKKLIFSINDTLSGQGIKRYKRDYKFTESEKKFLYPYILPYRKTFSSNDFIYLINDQKIQLLSPSSKGYGTSLAGPVSGWVNFIYKDNFEKGFYHEPFFEYEFNEEWLKMREFKNYPTFFNMVSSLQDIYDEVLTERIILKMEQNKINQKRKETPRYNNPVTTKVGNGTLVLKLMNKSRDKNKEPLNMILTKEGDDLFFRFYQGNAGVLYDLGRGTYTLTVLFPEDYYAVFEEISVEPNGLNYYETEVPEVLKKDAFSEKMTKLIEKNVYNYTDVIKQKTEVMEYQNLYYEQNYSSANGYLIQGILQDESGPIPGVSVLVKGSNRGTETDFDGHYSIFVNNGEVLVFSYVGMNSQEVKVTDSQVLNLTLTGSENLLEEVVITAMGMRTEKSLMSANTIKTELLPFLNGKMSGVQVMEASGITGSSQNIKIRGVNSLTADFGQKALVIINGVPFEGDLSKIDLSSIKEVHVLKDAAAVSLYGSRAANGVIVIETGQVDLVNASDAERLDLTIGFPDATLQESSIRSRFSDEAFWQPSLVTDRKGKAKFTVTYPDDVTSWDLHFIAVEGKKTGVKSTQVKSFKPLLAQLFVPRFLVKGDSVVAIGKSLNYMQDTLQVNRHFEVNAKEVFQKNSSLHEVLIDSLPFTATQDSVKIKYYLQKPDGYFDGEIRDIPVYEVGLEKISGAFYTLDHDTIIQPHFNPDFGNVKLYFRADVLDVLKEEMEQIKYYKYDCNEQMASKLKIYLAEKTIQNVLGEKFSHDNEVEKLIRKLLKNQNAYHLWGWWNVSETTPWISLQVLEALSGAEKMGYKVGWNKGEIAKTLAWMFANTKDFDAKARILKSAVLLKAQVDMNGYLTNLEQYTLTSLSDELKLTELKQLLGRGFDTSVLFKNSKETLFGNVYLTDSKQEKTVCSNDIQNTLLAYKIIQRDSVLSVNQAQTLKKMQNYFLEKRNTGTWMNTYESAQIVEAILPDVLASSKKLTLPEVSFLGTFTKKITEFPFSYECNPSDTLKIKKTGSSPVYMSVSQTYWEHNPVISSDDFEIQTRFLEDTMMLEAGKEVTLYVDVKVKKDAEYVMLNVPIPAGCSYSDSDYKGYLETHREHFKNKTDIFCQYLKQGEYTFEIKLNPRYSGAYTLNPAQVQLMYFPVFNANNELKRVKIF